MKSTSKIVAFGLVLLSGCKNIDHDDSLAMQTGVDYPVYGGNKAGNRYSPLTQVNINNIKNLEVAWTYFANEKEDTGSNKNQGEVKYNVSP